MITAAASSKSVMGRKLWLQGGTYFFELHAETVSHFHILQEEREVREKAVMELCFTAGWTFTIFTQIPGERVSIVLLELRKPLNSKLFQALSFPSHCPNLPLCH